MKNLMFVTALVIPFCVGSVSAQESEPTCTGPSQHIKVTKLLKELKSAASKELASSQTKGDGLLAFNIENDYVKVNFFMYPTSMIQIQIFESQMSIDISGSREPGHMTLIDYEWDGILDTKLRGGENKLMNEIHFDVHYCTALDLLYDAIVHPEVPIDEEEVKPVVDKKKGLKI